MGGAMMQRLLTVACYVLISRAQEADLPCTQGPNAAAWAAAKKRIRLMIDETSGFKMIPRETLAASLQEVIGEVKAVNGFGKEFSGECGYGRLSIQLLSLATEDDPAALAQSMQQLPQLSNPVMTTLLDVPWLATALSGWPIFGILAQLALRKVEMFSGAVDNKAIDGLETEVDQMYFTAMQKGIESVDFISMAQASYEYLQLPVKTCILGDLTATATQASVQSDVKQRTVAVNTLQKAFREAFSAAAQLDLALTTRWPLWSMCHIAVDAFSAD